jgi:heat shock protein HtpX
VLPAFGLYTHIRANRVRSVVLIAGLFVLVYLLTYATALGLRAYFQPGDPLSFYLRQAGFDLLRFSPLVTLGAGLWIVAAYGVNQALIDLVTGAVPVSRANDGRLYELLENLCISRGLPVPQLKIIETEAVNAFASGLNEKQYSITLTRGLLRTLTPAEVEAVIAHELTHIRNEDVRLMVVAVVITGGISFFGELVFRWLGDGRSFRSNSSLSDRDSKGKGGALLAILIALALIGVAWALSLVIRFALSRSREYLADAGAVELTKNPDAMISALLKIEGRGELEAVPSSVMEMCVDNPRSGFADLFATHPSIEDRVTALERFAGGRRPPASLRPWGEGAAASGG